MGGGLVNGRGKRSFTLINRGGGGQKSFNLEKGGFKSF